MNKTRKYLLLPALLLPLSLGAKITLPGIFGDHMVLQQNSTTGLWGEAKPSSEVSVTTSWDGKTYKVKSDGSGKWRAEIGTPAAGGPYSIVISDGKKLTLSDVLIGEVWLCSGQSNMEYRFSDQPYGYGKALEDAESRGNIRLLHIDNRTSFKPEDEAAVRYGGWEVCSRDALFDFSCVGYYFGRHLADSLNVPVGLIESAWGATFAENWVSRESLSTLPDFGKALEEQDALPQSRAARDSIYDARVAQWCREISDGNSISDLTDEGWSEVQVPGYIEYQGINEDGIIWMRKTVDIPKSWAGKTLKMDLETIDDHDFTYFNGVEIGHTEGCSSMRHYTVPGHLVKAGKAEISVRIVDIVGYAGFNGRPDRITLSCGKKSIPLSGTWKIKCTRKYSDIPRFPDKIDGNPFMPCVLYNAMINPLLGYRIKGAIWYQGESNTAMHAQYSYLLQLLIRDWRSKWGYDFPFYVAQLASLFPLQKVAEDFDWAYLRESQADALHLDNVGLAVLTDVGDEYDIHPKNKYDVGKRLALNALHGAYGMDIPYSGPVFRDYETAGSEIRIRFGCCDGGLVAMDGTNAAPASSEAESLRGFWIAGGDRVFHRAEARIEGDTVVVSCPEVKYPVAVRYGWANYPDCNLYNGALLPAVPFRTDRWAQTTPGNF